MREIPASKITQTIKELFLQACLCPPRSVIDALDCEESSEQGREVLRQLKENAKISLEENIPYCQDTGMAVVFMDVGQDAHIVGDLTDAVNEGVRQAYTQGYYRKSVLTPLGRINTGDNTPCILHTRLVPGQGIHIEVSPKGFGSENMSKIAMLKPSDGKQGIIDFAINTARQAGGSPCPPVVLGIGIGGTFEYAALMAKRQLLREIGAPSADPELAQMEKEIKDGINALKMGPMGIGGDNYCLAVHIESYFTHLAGLPVAVNYCCHALRHAAADI